MSQKLLTGKTAFITGAVKRIGRSIAEGLAKEGCNIIIHYNSSEQHEAETVCTLLKKQGVQAGSVKADFSSHSAIADLFPTITSLSGSVDILINNASQFIPSQLLTSPIDELHNTLAVNTLAPFMLARAFSEQTTSGSIINLIDTRIDTYDSTYAFYHLSKVMLAELTRMLAVDCAPHIRVNGIAPGIILPPQGKDPAYLERCKERTLVNHAGTVDEINNAVMFLLTTSSTTGEILYVDGGQRIKERLYNAKN